jgi:hypothetical protein
MHQDPFTLVCVDATIRPVPFGVVVAWLSWRSTGSPPERTRDAADVHCAVTHGMYTVPTTYEHPLIVWVVLCVTMGSPFAFTRALRFVAEADPPWTHCTVAFAVSR